jgi:hypothetical protein
MMYEMMVAIARMIAIVIAAAMMMMMMVVMVTVMAIAVVVAIVSPESFTFTVWIRETTGTSGTIPVDTG